MENKLFTLKNPKMGLEIDGTRFGANQLTKEKVLALINRDSTYGQYFHLPLSKKEQKQEKKLKNKDKS